MARFFYNLGKSLELQGDDDKAFDAYYKAIWSDAWRSQGYLKLAKITSRRGSYQQTLVYANEAMWAGYKNMNARTAVTVLHHLRAIRHAQLLPCRLSAGCR